MANNSWTVLSDGLYLFVYMYRIHTYMCILLWVHILGGLQFSWGMLVYNKSNKKLSSVKLQWRAMGWNEYIYIYIVLSVSLSLSELGVCYNVYTHNGGSDRHKQICVNTRRDRKTVPRHPAPPGDRILGLRIWIPTLWLQSYGLCPLWDISIVTETIYVIYSLIDHCWMKRNSERVCFQPSVTGLVKCDIYAIASTVVVLCCVHRSGGFDVTFLFCLPRSWVALTDSEKWRRISYIPCLKKTQF